MHDCFLTHPYFRIHKTEECNGLQFDFSIMEYVIFSKETLNLTPYRFMLYTCFCFIIMECVKCSGS